MRVIEAKTTVLYQWTAESGKPVVIQVGGAGSGKSYAIARYILTRLYSEPGIKILVTRKTLPALKITAEKIVLDMMKEDGVYQVARHDRTSRIYTHVNGGFVMFSSTDDPEKRKSEEWNIVWMEEATEFSWEDYTMISSRMRAKATSGPRQILLSLNPSDEYHWTHTKLEGLDYVDTFYSTVEHNPFADVSYIAELDRFKDVDDTFYKVMRLGQWASTQGVIYRNWTATASPWSFTYDTFGGLDFGFTNPTAIVECRDTTDGIHIRERLYEAGMTNADIIAWLNANWKRDMPLYADSAEPDRIEEIRRAGFMVRAADKEVKLGIDFVARHHLIIHDSGNIEQEIRSYRRRTYKGDIIDDPLKVNDHAMDAMRYAIFSHLFVPATDAGYVGLGGKYTRLNAGAF